MSTEFRNRIKQDWSDNNEKRYKWIYNKLSKEMPNFNYDLKDYLLKINKPKLLTFINTLDIGASSKESMYFTVSKYLQLFDKKIHILIKSKRLAISFWTRQKRKRVKISSMRTRPTHINH